ncbi:MAG TPA: hypothetical protein VMK12_25655 [Anaeromyxobacteraceae bacterium]|nr:hypothetical protein [Anaeromyxobacteraceae bacterium]
MKSGLSVLVVAGLLAFASGCSGGRSDGGSSTGGKQYVYTSTNFFGSSITSYMAATSSLGNVAPDYTKAVEIQGDALVAAADDLNGTVYLVTDVSPQIAKYTVAVDGTFTAGPVLDLSEKGYSGMKGHRGFIQFISPTKAYLIDVETLQIIVWDPSQMAYVKTVSMSNLMVSNESPEMNFEPRFRGTELVFTVHYSSGSVHTAVQGEKFVFVDTTTDTLQVIDYASCGGLRESAVASNGDIYFGVGASISAENSLGVAGSATPCIVRIKAGAHEIDPTFTQKPSDLTGLAISGNLFKGPNDTFFTMGFDPSLYTGTTPPTSDDYFYAPAWKFFKATLGSSSAATLVAGMPASVAAIFPLEVDGVSYLTTTPGDFSTSTLWDTSTDPPTKGLVFKDLFGNAVRVR